MSAAEKTNTSSTAEAKPTPAGRNVSQASRDDHGSETEFLAQEAEKARVAIQQAMRQLKADLGGAVDIKAWTKDHPWIAVSIAAATGFVAATAVDNGAGESKQGKIPSSVEEAAKERDFAELYRVVRAEIEKGGRRSGKSKQKTGVIFGALSWLGAIVAELLKSSTQRMIRQALQSDSMSSTAKKVHDRESYGNGRHPAPPSAQSTE